MYLRKIMKKTNSNIKLGFVIHTFDDSRGGKEVVTWNLVSRLLEMGVRTELVCSRYKSLEHPLLNIHKVPMPGKAVGLDGFFFARNAFKKTKELDINIIYTNGKSGFGDIVRLGGLPHKVHIRTRRAAIKNPFKRALYSFKKRISLKNKISLYLERKTYKNQELKKVITCSRYVKKNLLEAYPALSPGKVEVVYNGFDFIPYDKEIALRNRIEIRNKHGLTEDEPVYLFAGNNFERKGLDRVIAFMKITPGFKLIVAGRGRRRRCSPQLKSRISWAGEAGDIVKYYDAADVLILPSASDGFGLVVPEALARGCYVMVSQNAGASEIIDGYQAGLTFPFRDFPEKISPPEMSVVRNENFRQARRELARQLSWEKMSFKYLDVFREVLDTGDKD